MKIKTDVIYKLKQWLFNELQSNDLLNVLELIKEDNDAVRFSDEEGPLTGFTGSELKQIYKMDKDEFNRLIFDVLATMIVVVDNRRAHPVVVYDLSHQESPQVFKSANQAGKFYGVDKAVISKVARGERKRFKHYTAKYIGVIDK